MQSYIIYAFIAVISLQSIIHHFERRDLYNRIMSHSLTEYKKDNKPPMSVKSAHDEVINRWRGKGGDKN